MDYWFSVAVRGEKDGQLIDNIFQALATETPRMISVVGERICNFQCAHCLFQEERSSESESVEHSQHTAIASIVGQMGSDPLMVHEGRIFRPRHLEWLQMTRDKRPDFRIGMIDTGTFLRHADALRASDFRFDWIDISIDGTENVHNRQRRSDDAFRTAMTGIAGAPEFIAPGGRLSSLFTLTRVNYASLADLGLSLPREIDEWHITTISPVRPEIAHLSATNEEFARAWQQAIVVASTRKVFLRIYLIEDLLKLVRAVGSQKFLAAYERAAVDLATSVFEIDGVTVLYYPKSVCTSETFVIDADAHYRLPYSIAYTLKELQEGRSRFGDDISDYTVGRVDEESNFASLYQKGVSMWRESFGEAALKKEIEAFDRIRNGN